MDFGVFEFIYLFFFFYLFYFLFYFILLMKKSDILSEENAISFRLYCLKVSKISDF